MLSAEALLVGRLTALLICAQPASAEHLDAFLPCVVDAVALLRGMLVAVRRLASFILEGDTLLLAALTTVTVQEWVPVAVYGLAPLVIYLDPASPGMGDAVTFPHHMLIATILFAACIGDNHTILFGMKFAVVLFVNRCRAPFDLTHSRTTYLVHASRASMSHAKVFPCNVLPATWLDTSFATIIHIYSILSSMYSAPTLHIRVLVTFRYTALFH